MSMICERLASAVPRGEHDCSKYIERTCGDICIAAIGINGENRGSLVGDLPCMKGGERWLPCWGYAVDWIS